MKIDHFMWACSDLAEGIATIANLTGVTAKMSGSHPGQGTRNALMSLGEDCYLEIIAPDPDQPLENNTGSKLQALKAPGLLSWAVRTDNLHSLWTSLVAKNLKPGKVIDASRENGAGERLTWQLLAVKGISEGPFFIDWLETIHPAKTSPEGCQLVSFEIITADAELHRSLYGSLDHLVLVQGESPAMHLTIRTPKGEVVLGQVDPMLEIF